MALQNCFSAPKMLMPQGLHSCISDYNFVLNNSLICLQFTHRTNYFVLGNWVAFQNGQIKKNIIKFKSLLGILSCDLFIVLSFHIWNEIWDYSSIISYTEYHLLIFQPSHLLNKYILQAFVKLQIYGNNSKSSKLSTHEKAHLESYA